MKEFCTNWLRENEDEINLKLGNPRDNFRFLHGIYVVPLTDKHTIPLLKRVGELIPIREEGRNKDGDVGLV
jgi:hypothetical protein